MTEFTREIDIELSDYEVTIEIETEDFVSETGVDEVAEECWAQDADAVINVCLSNDENKVIAALIDEEEYHKAMITGLRNVGALANAVELPTRPDLYIEAVSNDNGVNAIMSGSDRVGVRTILPGLPNLFKFNVRGDCYYAEDAFGMAIATAIEQDYQIAMDRQKPF